MRTRYVLILLALVLGVGLLWLTRGARGGGEEVVPEAARRATAPGPTAAALEPARVAEVPASATDAAGDARQALQPSTPGPARATRAGRGEGAAPIVGRVLAPGGTPVARARVLAGGPGSWSQRAALDASRDALETETGADGRFRITGLEAGAFRLAVRAPGHAPLDLENLALPAGSAPHDVGELVLTRGLILGGVVLDADGAPVAGASLVRWAEADAMAAVLTGEEEIGAVLATTGSDGRFRIDVLAPGAWTLLVSHPDHPDRSVRGADFDVDHPRDDLEIRLERGLSIRGRAVGPAEVSGLVVRATPVVKGDRFVVGAGLDDGGAVHRREAVTGDAGEWTIGGLRAGSYQLRLRRRTGAWVRDWVGEPVTAQAGDTGVVLTVPASNELVLRVVDAKTGAALSELSMTLESEGASWSTSLELPAVLVRTDPSTGVTRVSDLSLRASAERVSVVVHKDGYASGRTKDLAYAPGALLDAGVLELAPLASVPVRVLDAATGRGIAGARVEVFAFDGDLAVEESILAAISSSSSWGRADADGLARMPAAETGTLWITATADGYQTSAPVASTLAAAPIVIALGRGGRVTVLVVDGRGSPVPGARVRAAHTPSRIVNDEGQTTMREETCDAAGRATFETLEDGLHTFSVLGEDRGLFALFELAAPEEVGVVVEESTDETIRLVAPARGVLLGTVQESGRPLVGARLHLQPKSQGEEAPSFLPPGLLPRASTDTRGGFEFEPVRVGDYRLTVEHSERAMPALLEMRIEEGTNARAVQLFSSAIEGRVLDEAGEPVPAVEVSVESEEESLSMRFTVSLSVGGEEAVLFQDDAQSSVLTAADGRYRLHGVMPNVRLRVSVRGRWIESTSVSKVRVRPDETETGVDFRVRAAGRLLVRVSFLAGQPVVWRVAAHNGPRRAETDSVGTSAELSGLAPGEWTVELQREGEQPLARVVRVVAGETAETVFEVP